MCEQSVECLLLFSQPGGRPWLKEGAKGCCQRWRTKCAVWFGVYAELALGSVLSRTQRIIFGTTLQTSTPLRWRSLFFLFLLSVNVCKSQFFPFVRVHQTPGMLYVD